MFRTLIVDAKWESWILIISIHVSYNKTEPKMFLVFHFAFILSVCLSSLRVLKTYIQYQHDNDIYKISGDALT